MVVKPINSYQEFSEILNSGKPIVIDFWATWCGPCRFISPVFEKMSNDSQYEGIDFYKVDVDEQQQISQEVGIRAMPTFMAFHNGQKSDELVGANPGGLQALMSGSKAIAAAA